MRPWHEDKNVTHSLMSRFACQTVEYLCERFYRRHQTSLGFLVLCRFLYSNLKCMLNWILITTRTKLTSFRAMAEFSWWYELVLSFVNCKICTFCRLVHWRCWTVDLIASTFLTIACVTTLLSQPYLKRNNEIPCFYFIPETPTVLFYNCAR